MNKIAKSNLWKNSIFQSRNYTVGQDLKNLGGVSITEAQSKDSFDAGQYYKGKKVVLVGVVGAFTGTCGKQIPAYIEKAKEFYNKGVDEIHVLTVNDAVVTNTWAESMKSKDEKIKFISDWNASFTKALDKQIDLSNLGFGVRSTRFSALIDNGVVKIENVSANPGQIQNTDADTILKQI